ncbi:MAG: zinc ABC transporter substrate-binding protein, partial [Pseudomonadota bacterium]
GSAIAEPNIIATVGMVGQPTDRIASGCANVSTMMAAGIDPHLYKPSSGDVKQLFESDAIIYVGNHLEGQMGSVLGDLNAKKPVLAAAEKGVSQDVMIVEEGAEYPDPHIWMDVELWSGIATPIAALLEDLDPGCEGAQERAGAYQAELIALDKWISEAIATIPQDQRSIVTAHDAFAYYGRAYGIDVVAIQGVSTESEAGIADIREVVDTVIEQNVPAIFVESTINPRTVEAVVEAAAARGHTVRVGGELYSDAMGETGTAEGTYIGMLASNTKTIVEALGGTVPPLPAELSEWSQHWGEKT